MKISLLFFLIWGRLLLSPSLAQEFFKASLDHEKPYVIAFTKKAAELFPEAIARAYSLHPKARKIEFDPGKLDPLFADLKTSNAYYCQLFLAPNELDVEFAWDWFRQSIRLDDDPFVDLRTGIITGRNGKSAEEFVNRIAAVVNGKSKIPRSVVDNLNINPALAPNGWEEVKDVFMIPGFNGPLKAKGIHHGRLGFTTDRYAAMSGFGVVHFGGHGYPDKIEEGITGREVRALPLAPSIVFNGACYNGVTGRWLDVRDGNFKSILPAESFCLNILETKLVGYFSAVHPDHGMPVYQEMEYWASTGAPLGEVHKHSLDAVVLGYQTRLPDFKSLPPARGFPGRVSRNTSTR